MEIQRIVRYTLSLALTAVFLLHVADVVHIPILTSLENQAYDSRLKITLPEQVDRQVVIIDIDEKSLDEIGQWPWNRNVLAKINDALFDYYQIKVIGYDIVFADEGAKLLDKMAMNVDNKGSEFRVDYLY